jgi:lipopolysaccharide transport protein LptA
MKRILVTAMASIIVSVAAAVPVVNAADGAATADTSAPPAVAKSPLPGTGSTNEPTIITSEQLHGDYLHNVGTFEGNVLAVDPRMTVRADKMTVFFGGTNIVTAAGTNTTRSVQKIIADGGVVITTPDNKKSNSDRAVYTAQDGQVVLTGHPRAESPDGIVTGKQITFWRDSQKMDVVADEGSTNRTKLLIYPEDQRKENNDANPKPKDSTP